MQGEVQIMFDELNIPITFEEISVAIKQLSNGKSGGLDKILNELFRHGRESLLTTLHIMFNVIYSRGHFPKSWSLECAELPGNNTFKCFG